MLNFAGICFNDISAKTIFSEGSTGAGSLKADISLQLRGKKMGSCAEHLQFSTAFSDSYDFYLRQKTHTLSLDFTDPYEVIDLKQNGLQLFNYCANSFEILTSTFSTALLFVGGGGSSDFLPVFGAAPTNYQIKSNQRVF